MLEKTPTAGFTPSKFGGKNMSYTFGIPNDTWKALAFLLIMWFVFFVDGGMTIVLVLGFMFLCCILPCKVACGYVISKAEIGLNPFIGRGMVAPILLMEFGSAMSGIVIFLAGGYLLSIDLETLLASPFYPVAFLAGIAFGMLWLILLNRMIAIDRGHY